MAVTVPQDYEIVRLAELVEHPDNPRQGDVGAIYESITTNGFYGALIVQRSTGRILAGNHRYKAARDAGLTELPAIVVDVDDDTAARILVVDNRSNDLATHDEAALVELLKGLALTPEGLAGTGFDGDDLDGLVARLESPSLGDLADRYGDDDEKKFWPLIRVQVPPDTHKRWEDAFTIAKGAAGGDDAGAIEWILDRVDEE